MITEAKVEEAIKKMKLGKCTGPDDIWKIADIRGVRYLTGLFNKIMRDNRLYGE